VDALVRRRRALLIGALAAPFAISIAGAPGCGGRASAPGVGTSHHGGLGHGPADAGDGGFVDGAGSLPAAYRTSFTKVNRGRFVSQGHAAGRWEADVYANEAAARALATRTREVPVGAVVVQEHFERSSGDVRTPGPVMVMEKRPPGFAKEHGDWRWAVVGSQGQLVKDGVIDACAGCHDDAPMDGLFPVVE